MPFRSAAFALVLLLFTAPLAKAGVGFQHFSIPDPQGPPIEVGVWYPADQSANGAPVAGAHLPLVVMSHGTGAHFAAHRDTAVALAEAGFVAAALTHTGDNYRDHSRAIQIWDRPRQLKVLTDYMLSTWAGRDRIDPGRIGAFGFSAGGFTVLAAAGGEPDLSAIQAHCQAHPDYFDCKLIAAAGKAAGPPAGFTWTHDSRIRSVVAAAPALGFTFGRQGLAQIHQPVQLWRAENDQVLPNPDYAEAVRAALPRAPEFHLVANAGHYDFLNTCSADLAQEAPEICTSAPGFDRSAFHAEFNRDVVAFFRRTLPPAP